MKRILLAVALAATTLLLGCSDYWAPRTERNYVFDPMMGSILGASAAPDSGADSLRSNATRDQGGSPSEAASGSEAGPDRGEPIPSSLSNRLK